MLIDDANRFGDKTFLSRTVFSNVVLQNSFLFACVCVNVDCLSRQVNLNGDKDETNHSETSKGNLVTDLITTEACVLR